MSGFYEYTAGCNDCMEYQDITSERDGAWNYNDAELILESNGWYRNVEGDWVCPKHKEEQND